MSEAGSIGVRIALESRQDGGEPQTGRFAGQLFVKPGAVYIRYEEHAGTARRIGTTVRWDGRELKLLRRGAVEGAQSFAAGRRLPGTYRAQEAAFALETQTAHIRALPDIRPAEGVRLPFELQWSYELLVQGQSAGHFDIRLTIQGE